MMILKWVELDCLHHTPPPLRCSIEMPRSLPRCSPPVRLGRIVRRTMDRWCCLGALFGIFLGLPLTMIVQMHRCAPAATFSRGYYTDPTLEAYGTHHAIESAAWKLPNKLVVVISLSTCDSQEVEDTLSSLGRDVPSDSVRFYSCCEDLRLSSDQCFMHRRLNCSSGRSLSLLTVLNHLWQHEASNHQWFLLASSLTYINYELLVQFLDHLDSEELFYLGRPVRTAEHTTSSWIYCEGGAGVVISRSLLRGLRPGMCSEQEDIKEDALLGCCISEKYHIDCWGGIDKVRIY